MKQEAVALRPGGPSQAGAPFGPGPRVLRIGFVSDNYPHGGHAGGIGTYTKVMAGCLARRGHDVHVFAGGGRGQHRDGRVVVHLTEPVGERDSIGVLLERTVTLTGPFDVLEAPEFRALGAVAVGRRDLTQVLAVRLHGAETILGHRPDMWQALGFDPEEQVVAAADVVTAPSRSAVQLTDQHWGTQLAQRVVVVPNPGPDLPPGGAGLQPKSAARYDVAFLGRLEPRKGIDVLAQVLERAQQLAGRTLSVVVAGADHPWGQTRTGLSLLADSGAEVTYRGVLDHAQALETMACAKVALVPSRAETFGLTLLEAMSVGVPAVASDIASFRELVGPAGRVPLLPLERPQLWATQVAALVDDPALAARQARAGLSRAAAFAPQRVADALVRAWCSPPVTDV